MSGGSIFHRIRLYLFGFLAALVFSAGPGAGQTAAPTIIDFWTKSDVLFLEISLNAEALIAGVDPSSEAEVTNNRQYLDLRNLVSSELEPHVKSFAIPWMQSLDVKAGGPVALSYEGVGIPIVGDPRIARTSKLLLTGALPEGAATMQLIWPANSGPVVLRQHRVAAPYTGYLEAGEASPVIPLQGGAAMSVEQTLQTFFANGIVRIVQRGTQQVVLALALVFLSLHLRPVCSQLAFLSAAVFIGLTLSTLGAVNLPQAALSHGLPVAIVVLAVWNLFLRRARILRVLAVSLAGLVQGAILAESLTMPDLPPIHLPPAILGFGAGVTLTQCAMALAIFAIAIAISGQSHRRRGRVSVLASMAIAGLGAYWLVKPMIFA